MVDIQQTLRAVLIGDTAIAAVIGNRVHARHLPQNPVFPAVVTKVISTFVHEDLQGPSGIETARVEFQCCSLVAATSNSLARLCQNKLAAIQQQAVSGVWIEGVSIAGGLRDDQDPPLAGSADWIEITAFDVKVTYQTG